MMIRTTAVAALAAVAVLAPAASAATRGFTGKDTNRYGTTTLRFDESRGQVTLKLSARVGSTSKRKSFSVQCRSERGGRYTDTVGFVPLSDQRTLTAPFVLTADVDTCRVKRNGRLVIATMKMRRL